MSEPKNQHYVPQFYLKGFTRLEAPGKLYVFDNGNSYWSERGVKNVASQDYLHSYKTADGSMNHDVENLLSRLETPFSTVLNKVLTEQVLTADEEITFSTFIAVMWQRVPVEVDHYNSLWTQVGQKMLQLSYYHYTINPDALEQAKSEYERRTGKNDIQSLRPEDFDPSRVQITANPLATLLVMLKAAVEVSKIILDMGWTFLKSEKPDYYITSDHPFYMVDPTNDSEFYGSGLRHTNVEISLPLSRNVAFFAGWKSTGRRWLPTPMTLVEEMNRRTSCLACRELIAPSRNFPGADRPLTAFYRGRE